MLIDMSILGVIRFIDAPQGEVPEKIRRQWVGVEVPCLFLDNEDSNSYGVLTGKLAPTHASYLVFQVHALDALAETSPDAAWYWKGIGYPTSEYALWSFNAESVEVLKPPLSKEEFLELLPQVH
jgi:hypothetical protein